MIQNPKISGVPMRRIKLIVSLILIVLITMSNGCINSPGEEKQKAR